MRYSIIMIALMATIPMACSAETAGNKEMAEAVEADIPMVSDAMKVPVFTGPAGSANVAVSGYDTVSYFEGDGVPVEGSQDHRVKYNGVEYHFASAENAEKFLAEPARYVPKYGGHCAWAASRGKLASGDPTKYKIVDGELYLNFDEAVQQKWLKDIPGFIEKADKEFPKISPDARFDDA